MIRFSERRDIHACRLNLDGLQKLYDLVLADVPNRLREDDISVRASFDGADISESNLNDFLAHKNLPDTLTRLSIGVTGWDGSRNIEKNVSLSFYENHVSLDVSGFQQSWVLGFAGRVEKLLRSNRPWYWFLFTPNGYMVRGIIFMLATFGAGVAISLEFERKVDLTTFALVFASGAAMLLLWFVRRFRYVEIHLVERHSFWKRHEVAFAVLVGGATVVGAVAAVAALFLH